MKRKKGFYEKYIKRMLDIVCSLLALAVFGIPMLILMLLIKFNMGSPVIFVQERIGKDEKPFNMYKLRSMKTAYDEYGVPLPDDQRLTNLGRFIRKCSLDELPNLVNILKGEMSIIGPRPLPTAYLPWFKEDERIRHTVRGGLTGLAQVNGRNAASWETRFAYDKEYVENIIFINDIKIIINTVLVVIKRKDIGVRGKSSLMDFHVYRSGLTERELMEKERV